MITTLGVFTTHSSAENAINECKANGMSQDNLSYLYKNESGTLTDGEANEKMSSSAVTGAAAGAVIGGIAALIVANGILPGFGTFYIAGPLATALGISEAVAVTAVGVAGGTVAGGLVGALTKFGVDKTDAILYQEHVHKGNILVIVQDTAKSMKELFLKHETVETREYTETS